MSERLIHIELTEDEARAHLVCHSVGTAVLANRLSRALEKAAELWMQPEIALLEQSAMKKICRAVNPEAADYADAMMANRKAAQERRN